MMKKRTLLMCFVSALAFVAKAQTEATLTVSDFTIAAGGRATVTIDSDVALSEYCSFQFDVLLPEGITMPYNMNPDEEEEQYGYYDEDNEEWVPAVTSGICKSSHVLTCSAIKGGYRFVCYHSKFTVFKSGSKNVLTLVLEASADVVNGVYSPTVGGTDVFIAGETSHIIPSAVAGTAIVTGGSQESAYRFTMSTAGWGTLMLPFDADVPAGLVAYGCAAVSEGAVVLAQSAKLLANTPYIMEGEAGEYDFRGVPTMTQASYDSGVLTGVYADTEITEGYVLQRLNGEVAFYRVDASDPITVPACHCYLSASTESAAMVRLRGTTGIDGMESEERGSVYDMSGKKVYQPAEKGVYIRGNKKVIIK